MNLAVADVRPSKGFLNQGAKPAVPPFIAGVVGEVGSDVQLDAAGRRHV